MTTFTLACGAALLLAAGPAFAQQGVVMVVSETSGGQTAQSRMQLDRTHVRAEVRDRGQQMAVTYDATSKVMRIIDTAARTYTEVTQQDLQQMSGAMAQMQEQMKNMPPDQRQMMEQMMRGRGGAGMPGMPAAPAAPARPTFKKTGTAKVGQWACTTYEGFSGAEKVAEVCAADSGIDLTAADFQVVQQLADQMKSMAPQTADQLAVCGTAESQGFAGFPVRRVTFKNGRPDTTSELTELKRETLPASTFEVPAGFKKQSIGGGR